MPQALPPPLAAAGCKCPLRVPQQQALLAWPGHWTGRDSCRYEGAQGDPPAAAARSCCTSLRTRSRVLAGKTVVRGEACRNSRER